MSKQHKSNSVWGGIAGLVHMGCGFLSVIMAIHALGASQYGYLSLFMALNHAWLMLNKGFFTSVTRHLVLACGTEEDQGTVLGLLRASRTYVVSVSVLVLTVGLVAGDRIVLAILGEDAADEMSVVFLLVVFVHFIRLWINYNVAGIEGFGRFDLAARGQLFSPVAILLFLVWWQFQPESISLVLLVEWYLVVYSSELCILLLVRSRLMGGSRHYQGIEPKSSRIFKTLLGEGYRLQAAGFASMLIEPVNKLVVNHFLGPAAVTSYDLAVRIVNAVNALFASAFRGFMQLAPKPELARDQFYKATSYLFVPTLILYGMGGTMLVTLITSRYLEVQSEVVWLYLVLLPSGLAISLVSPLYHVLVARGESRYILGLHARLAVVNVTCSLLLVNMLGLVGAGAGIALATLYNAFSVYGRFNSAVISTEKVAEVFKQQVWTACSVTIIASLGGFGVLLLPPVYAMTLGASLLLIGSLMLLRLPVTGQIFKVLGR